MIESKYEKQSVDRLLCISEGNLIQMKNNNIKTLGELAKHKASELKVLGLQENDINNIKNELGLLGMRDSSKVICILEATEKVTIFKNTNPLLYKNQISFNIIYISFK